LVYYIILSVCKSWGNYEIPDEFATAGLEFSGVFIGKTEFLIMNWTISISWGTRMNKVRVIWLNWREEFEMDERIRN